MLPFPPTIFHIMQHTDHFDLPGLQVFWLLMFSSEWSVRPRCNLRAEQSSHTTCIAGLWSTPTHQVIFTGNSSTSQVFLILYVYSWLLKSKEKKCTFVIFHFLSFTILFQAFTNIWDPSDSE